jgi:hypothetical protein
MPRELKFRVWIDGKREDVENLWWDIGASGYTIEINEKIFLDDPANVIIEQYTGRRDKNGTEIYEGDDLEYRGKFRETVEWQTTEKTEVEGHGSYSMRKFTGFYFSGYYGLPENAEVVGNIHE